jgi:DNA-binding NarL/FixJ family response regulator
MHATQERLKAEQLVHTDWGPLAVLTRRELEVLRLIAFGHENDEIAARIHRTKRAVEWHIKHLYDNLGCSHRAELFRFGIEAGLVSIEDAHWEQMLADRMLRVDRKGAET